MNSEKQFVLATDLDHTLVSAQIACTRFTIVGCKLYSQDHHSPASLHVLVRREIADFTTLRWNMATPLMRS